MSPLTLTGEQTYCLESRLAQLHSLGLLLTQVSTMESQQVEMTTLADLGRVIMFLAETTQEEFLQPTIPHLVSE